MGALLGCFGILIFYLGVSAGMGALTMVALGAFGVHVSFWVAWAIYIVICAIFNAASSTKD
jgi:hypothetical protein